MVELEIPSRSYLEELNDVPVTEFPRFARVEFDRETPVVENVQREAAAALNDLPRLDSLPSDARVAITAGSRGIDDKPALLEGIITELKARGLSPFVVAAMGSHGGATNDGQRETLASLGITEDVIGCPIKSSMAVDQIATDSGGRPVYMAQDAVKADAILLANRVKPHTDFTGTIESGLAKMLVIGLGKQHGAEDAHNAGLARGFEAVIRERTNILLDALPVIGGVALIDNANEQAALIEGVPADSLLEREAKLLDRAWDLFPALPIEDLDLLIVDEIGKDISGTCMDTNVIGRVRVHGQTEADSPRITRIYARSLTPASHGNALGIGLADFVHARVLDGIDLGKMYVNVATSSEPERAKIPFIVPCDTAALSLVASTTGVLDVSEMRVARIKNTLTPDTLHVSEPIAQELADRPNVHVGALEALSFDADGELTTAV